MEKSTRHSKITGNFGEGLVLYWLSKHGFECATLDHTGIDLIARHPRTEEVLGISVKSRSRAVGTEGTHINLRKVDFEKATKACDAFHCTPYYAIVADEPPYMRALLLPLSHLLNICPGGEKISAWSMSESSLGRYRADPAIHYFELQMTGDRWWPV